MDILEVITASRSPRQNAYAERLIGSIRRECLDHVIVWNKRELRRVCVAYYQRSSFQQRQQNILRVDAAVAEREAAQSGLEVVERQTRIEQRASAMSPSPEMPEKQSKYSTRLTGAPPP